MHTHLDLFAGIGGFSLAAHWAGFRTVAFAEICPDASRVLAYHWPGVPNLGSVSKLCRRAYDCEQRDADFGDCECVGTDEFTDRFGAIDLLTGGVPCQPASLLGTRRGTADERWLWPDTLRIVGELRPSYCVFENPPALLTLEGGRAFNGIISKLSALGYVGWYDVLPAAAIGAGHLRERVIIVAADAARWKSDDGRRGVLGQAERGRAGFDSPAWTSGEVAASSDASRVGFGNQSNKTDTIAGSGQTREISASGGDSATPSPDRHGARLGGFAEHGPGAEGWNLPTRPASAPLVRGLERDDWIQTESPVDPLVYGLPNKLVEAALRCVGNSVVPQVILPVLDAIRRQLDETRNPLR